MNVRFEGNNGHETDVRRYLLMTQSGDLTQNPPNIRPNMPGAGAGPGAGDGGVRPAVIVPWDRKTAGGFWDALDSGGSGPASSPGTPPGIGGVGPAWPYSSAASPSGDPASSVATAPKGSWVSLKASIIALGSPGVAGKPVFRLTRTSLMPGGARNGIGGWSARAVLNKSRTTGAETLPPVSPWPSGEGLSKPI